MKKDEPEIIINGINLGPGCALTIRVAIEVFAADLMESVCREFGNEMHPMLYCHFLDKNGKERSRQNKRLIERKSHKYISNYVKLQKENYGK